MIDLDLAKQPIPWGNTVKNGFSLMEVLVAVFVLALGVLGAATLQHMSKRSNYEAVQRTIATLLAEDLIERVRANSAQLSVYTNAGGGRTLSGATMAAPATDCSAAACDAVTLANYDLFEFEQTMIGITEISAATNTGGLSVPTACITGPAAAPGAVIVAIAWRGMTALSNPITHACGTGIAAYGAVDEFRRVLVLNTFIN